MEIKLYNENDSRPNGSYTKIKSAEILPNGTIVINRYKEGSVITNLKFKITIAEGEPFVYSHVDGCFHFRTLLPEEKKTKVEPK